MRCDNCGTEMEYNELRDCYDCKFCGYSTEYNSEDENPKYIR
ncbi:MAG: hypothetical protein M0R17_05560 [Candidatus Omnitrophica bacterium]|jgi:hypothetical protein|nr:hypothetical protein [Candidatus Omnitrophota bacterium]